MLFLTGVFLEEKIKFYNVLAHINYKNRLIEENVAVKNVWLKDDTVLLDLYFYRNQKSYVIDRVFIHDLTDLSTEKYYANPENFIKDFFSDGKNEIALHPSLTNKPLVIDKKVFEDIDVELVILTFLANRGAGFSEIKEKALHDYILANKPTTTNLSPQYMHAYLIGIKPSEEDYYKALDQLKTRTPEQATNIVLGSMKVCLSDGQFHYNEKLYIAELLQVLREQGLEPDINL